MKKAVVEKEPVSSEKQFWTIKDAARYLGFRDSTLHQWLNPSTNKRPAKLLGPPPPYYRFGRLGIRFPIKEFKQWAENFRQE